MKHKHSHLFVGYWHDLRGDDRIVPDRDRVSARELHEIKLWQKTFTLNVENPVKPVYGFTGGAIRDYFGRGREDRKLGTEVRGTPFLAHWDLRSGHQILAAIKTATRSVCEPFCLTSVAETEKGYVAIETILAPTAANNRKPSHFLGFMQPLEPLTGAIKSQRLTRLSFVSDNLPSGVDDTALFQPAEAVFEHPKARHLQLVHSRA